MIGLLGGLMYIGFMLFGKEVSDCNARENAKSQAIKEKLGYGDIYIDSKGKKYDAYSHREVFTLLDDKTRHTKAYDKKTGAFVSDLTTKANLRKIQELYKVGFRIFPTQYTEIGAFCDECFIHRLPLEYNVIKYEMEDYKRDKVCVLHIEKTYYVIEKRGRKYYFDPEKEIAVRSTEEQRIFDMCRKLEADVRGYKCENFRDLDDENIQLINEAIKEERRVVDILGKYKENWYVGNYKFQFVTIKPSMPEPKQFGLLEKWEETYDRQTGAS